MSHFRPAASGGLKLLNGRIRTTLRYLGSLGVRGPRNLWLGRRGDGVVALRVPGTRHPVWIRSRTSDLDVFDQVFVDRQYLVSGVRSPDYIVDAGANIGLASVWFARRYPGARIVAIEPDSGNWSLLSRNVAPYRGIVPLQAAVWSEVADLSIENPDDEPWAFRVRRARGADREVFRGVTVSSLLDAAAPTDRIWVKLDVEGAEREIFGSDECQRWLGRIALLIIETHDRFAPGCTAALEAAIAGHDFRRSVLGENLVYSR